MRSSLAEQGEPEIPFHVSLIMAVAFAFTAPWILFVEFGAIDNLFGRSVIPNEGSLIFDPKIAVLLVAVTFFILFVLILFVTLWRRIFKGFRLCADAQLMLGILVVSLPSLWILLLIYNGDTMKDVPPAMLIKQVFGCVLAYGFVSRLEAIYKKKKGTDLFSNAI